MATIIDASPRIVCVDCLQIAHVCYVEANPISNEVLVAIECCVRRLGTIHHDKFERLAEYGRKLTTNDVRPLEAHRVANRAIENIEHDTTRLNWARWAMEPKETA